MVDVIKTPDGRGYGLYATRHYARGERIGSYKGERITRREVDRRYGKGRKRLATYVVQVGEDSFVDGQGPLAFANDPVDLWVLLGLVLQGYSRRSAYSMATDRKKKNAMMRSFGGRATLYATRAIEPGEEIQWSYGWGYWMP